MSSIADGYTCGCGTWVPYGILHRCLGSPMTAPPPVQYITPGIDNTILERIAIALERIADKLDK
jgi:hypothetical protein